MWKCHNLLCAVLFGILKDICEFLTTKIWSLPTSKWTSVFKANIWQQLKASKLFLFLSLEGFLSFHNPQQMLFGCFSISSANEIDIWRVYKDLGFAQIEIKRNLRRFETVSFPLLLLPPRVPDWSGEELPTDHLETLPQLPAIHESGPNCRPEKGGKPFSSNWVHKHSGEKRNCSYRTRKRRAFSLFKKWVNTVEKSQIPGQYT